MESMKLSFGFSAISAGQRQGSNNRPEVVAVSTPGSFRVSGAVTRILGIMPGDYIQFVSNVDAIDAAILDANDANHAALVEFCQKKGLDITTPEAAVAIHAQFDEWGVCKGVLEVDKLGNAKQVTERITIKDKQAYVAAHRDEMLAQIEAAEGEDADKAREALSQEGITEEEVDAILVSMVAPKLVDSYLGSKTFSPSGLKGAGQTLNYTDNNIWNKLKADLTPDERPKYNRVFAIDLNDIRTFQVNNGMELVEVKGYTLGAYEDKEPAGVGAKAAEATEE